MRYEAAKLIEEEQEAEIEEAERRKAVSDETERHLNAMSHKLQDDNRRGSGWHESDSGMFWDPCDASVLDATSDGLAAMHAARQQAAALAGGPLTGSQDDDDNYTKGETDGLTITLFAKFHLCSVLPPLCCRVCGYTLCIGAVA